MTLSGGMCERGRWITIGVRGNCYMRIVKGLSEIKNKFVSNKIHFRRVKFGICRGYYFPINLRFQFRCFLGLYEMEICKFIKKYVEPQFCCYDIGSSIGYYSIALSHLAAPGKIYSFEADVKYCDLLRQTVQLNNVKSELIVSNNFIGNNVNEKQVSIDWLVYKMGF